MLTKSKLSCEFILKYYKELENCGVENHGLLIMQNGETIFEEYAYPYSADMPHTLFSVTKSVVSTAAGFAIQEGLFSLDDKIIDLFPEYEACKSDEWENLTVRSVLTMSSNKQFSFLQDMTGNYMEMFMKAPFRKEKGFLYSNNDAHVVAALVHKFSGQNLVEYLTPRLFKPLGIDIPQWETNEIGECIGGTGCYLKLRDLAKLCQCYADGGKYNGEQIIPEFWTREATKIQVPFKKENEGYGYLFWIKNGVFSMTGMFGQIISYIPQYNAVVATMNCCIDEGGNERAIIKVLSKAFENESAEEWDEKLKEYLENRKLKVKKGEEVLNVPTDKTFYMTAFSNKLANLMFPASVIPRSLTSSFAKRPKTNFNEVSFDLTEDVFTVKWKEEGDEVVINCGLDGEPRMSECQIKGYPYKIWAYAYSENGKINAVVKPVNTLSTQYMTFDFSGDTVKIQIKGTPSFPEFILKNALSPDFIKNNKAIKFVVKKAVNLLLSTTERPMKFKVK
ncbi:MAG: serine hydrolase [Acutalibacteraceae bacterium]|nr:serine hydrolase [Acutalibacteraceae bacterium]